MSHKINDGLTATQRYYRRHRGVCLQRQLSWRQRNSNYQNHWYFANKDQKDAKAKKWNREHPEFWREKMAVRRGLLHTEVYLNERFEGSVLHHLGKIDGQMTSAYIPENLHKSIPHSLLRNRKMNEINLAVFGWLTRGDD